MSSILIPISDLADVAAAGQQIQLHDGEQLVVEVTDTAMNLIVIDNGRRTAGFGTRSFTPVEEERRGW